MRGHISRKCTEEASLNLVVALWEKLRTAPDRSEAGDEELLASLLPSFEAKERETREDEEGDRPLDDRSPALEKRSGENACCSLSRHKQSQPQPVCGVSAGLSGASPQASAFAGSPYFSPAQSERSPGQPPQQNSDCGDDVQAQTQDATNRGSAREETRTPKKLDSERQQPTEADIRGDAPSFPLRDSSSRHSLRFLRLRKGEEKRNGAESDGEESERGKAKKREEQVGKEDRRDGDCMSSKRTSLLSGNTREEGGVGESAGGEKNDQPFAERSSPGSSFSSFSSPRRRPPHSPREASAAAHVCQGKPRGSESPQASQIQSDLRLCLSASDERHRFSLWERTGEERRTKQRENGSGRRRESKDREEQKEEGLEKSEKAGNTEEKRDVETAGDNGSRSRLEKKNEKLGGGGSSDSGREEKLPSTTDGDPLSPSSASTSPWHFPLGSEPPSLRIFANEEETKNETHGAAASGIPQHRHASRTLGTGAEDEDALEVLRLASPAPVAGLLPPTMPLSQQAHSFDLGRFASAVESEAFATAKQLSLVSVVASEGKGEEEQAKEEDEKAEKKGEKIEEKGEKMEEEDEQVKEREETVKKEDEGRVFIEEEGRDLGESNWNRVASFVCLKQSPFIRSSHGTGDSRDPILATDACREKQGEGDARPDASTPSSPFSPSACEPLVPLSPPSSRVLQETLPPDSSSVSSPVASLPLASARLCRSHCARRASTVSRWNTERGPCGRHALHASRQKSGTWRKKRTWTSGGARWREAFKRETRSATARRLHVLEKGEAAVPDSFFIEIPRTSADTLIRRGDVSDDRDIDEDRKSTGNREKNREMREDEAQEERRGARSAGWPLEAHCVPAVSVEGSDGENATEAVHLEGSAFSTREKPGRIETQTKRGGEQHHEGETLKETLENEDSRCMENALSSTGEDEKRGARKQRQKAASPPLTQASSSTASKNPTERDQERKEAEGCSICLRSHTEGRASSPNARPRPFRREDLGQQKEVRDYPEKERNRTPGSHDEEDRLHSTQKTGEETEHSGDRTASEKKEKRQSREEQWPQESPRRHSCLQKARECQGYKARNGGEGGEEAARGRQRRREREGEATRASDRVEVSPFFRHASARALRDDPRGRREKRWRKKVDLYKHALASPCCASRSPSAVYVHPPASARLWAESDATEGDSRSSHFSSSRFPAVSSASPLPPVFKRLSEFHLPRSIRLAEARLLRGQSSDALEDALRCVVEVRRFLEDSLPRRLSSSALSQRTMCLPRSVSSYWKIQTDICGDALRHRRRSSRHPSSLHASSLRASSLRASSLRASSPRSPLSSVASGVCSCSPASSAGDREGKVSQLSCLKLPPVFLSTQGEASAREISLKREARSAASSPSNSWKKLTFAATETPACTERSAETGVGPQRAGVAVEKDTARGQEADRESKTRCDASSGRSEKSEVSGRCSSSASQDPLEDGSASRRGSEKALSLCHPSSAHETAALRGRSRFCACASLSLLPRRLRRQERVPEREAEEEARRSGREEETTGRGVEESEEVSEEADRAGGERHQAESRREAGKSIEAASCTCIHRCRGSAEPERGDRQVERNTEGEEKAESRAEGAPEKEGERSQAVCTCQELQKREKTEKTEKTENREKKAGEGGREETERGREELRRVEETEEVHLSSSIACTAERSSCVVVGRAEWRATDGGVEVATLRESVCGRSWKKQRERERETREKKRSVCLRRTGEQRHKRDVVPPCRKRSAQEVQKITER
ncbi:hypothetical protein TGRUB_294650 [Toxoplasma gondii RUB]|uniref:Uncharacterized protein n=1 Tax=Toxoplasma gondii RUB TaxID=935652 RepID=A0A086LSC4_TOXGO|nr:hypothetical protein TGRUB_294650 [Toxoplasma gondii RUB]